MGPSGALQGGLDSDVVPGAVHMVLCQAGLEGHGRWVTLRELRAADAQEKPDGVGVVRKPWRTTAKGRRRTRTWQERQSGGPQGP